jgi:alpha-L-fucosidase 2
VTELVFDRPAQTWLEALPLGNGKLGAMCYGGTDRIRFDLNDETAWSGNPASEAGQPSADAHTAASLLARARQLIAADSFEKAEAPLKAMQSNYTQSYLPFATVVLTTRDLPAPTGYRRSLDLATATHEVRFRSGDVSMTHTTIASARHGVILHLIDSDTDAHAFDVELSSPLRVLGMRNAGSGGVVALLRLPSDVAPAHQPEFAAATWSEHAGDSVEGAVAARVVRETTALGRTRVAVFITTETTFAGFGEPLRGTADEAAERAVARVDAAVTLGADGVVEEHRHDHAALFSRVSLRLHPSHGSVAQSAGTTTERLNRAFSNPEAPLADDPGLAAVLFDYGRYLLLSSSRPGGLPATLQGLWSDSMQPPWSSNYTMNINLQMNYWQSYVVNAPETAQPLVDFIVRLAQAGEHTAKRLYGARGWVAHHNSDAWAYTSPVGARSADPAWAFWPMAGPWLISQLWHGVEFGMVNARELRERLWPVIRGATEFGLDWMIRMPDGSWGTMPSTSPENTFVMSDGRSSGLASSTAMDLSLLRELFEIAIAAAEQLGIDRDPVVDEAGERLASLPTAPAIGTDGRLLEWSRERRETDPHHRHPSPLYFVYPGRGRYDDAHRAAAVRTLEGRGDASTGWSLVWKLALWARLRRPDKVSDLLRLFFQPAGAGRGPWAGGLYPNLFAAHPPFQIDGNLGYVAALAEALLQSHAGAIDLLPALPADLDAGEVTGLVARPGVLVDIRWRDRALVNATLRARDYHAAGIVCIRYGERVVERLVTAEAEIRLVVGDFSARGAQASSTDYVS